MIFLVCVFLRGGYHFFSIILSAIHFTKYSAAGGAFHFLGEFSPQRRREHREKHKNLCGLCVSAVNLHILPKN